MKAVVRVPALKPVRTESLFEGALDCRTTRSFTPTGLASSGSPAAAGPVNLLSTPTSARSLGDNCCQRIPHDNAGTECVSSRKLVPGRPLRIWSMCAVRKRTAYQPRIPNRLQGTFGGAHLELDVRDGREPRKNGHHQVPLSFQKRQMLGIKKPLSTEDIALGGRSSRC
jgi:hypothetical protein